MNWNYNMDECPKSYFVEKKKTNRLGVESTYKEVVPIRVILCSADCGAVTVSRWLPKEERWNGFSKGRAPLAWMPFPEHPNKGENNENN